MATLLCFLSLTFSTSVNIYITHIPYNICPLSSLLVYALTEHHEGKGEEGEEEEEEEEEG